MPTKSTKAGGKDALTAKSSEASKHLQTSKPKSSAADKNGKSTATK